MLSLIGSSRENNKMRILEFEFENKITGWKLAPVKFDAGLNLLVGVSGVGKTQILKAIRQVQRIAKGKAVRGIYWKIKFSISENEYLWEGEFSKDPEEERQIIIDDDEDDESKIVRECLLMNRIELAFRDEANIRIKNQKSPTLAKSESIVHLMRDSESDYPEISEVSKVFDKIIHSDQTDSSHHMRYLISGGERFDSLKKQYNSLAKIKESSLDVGFKLCLVFGNEELVNEANVIKENFRLIFNQVEDLKLAWIQEFGRKFPILKLKEKDIDEWVEQSNFSSGMFRTLMHIAELYLLPDHSVILIDEFENSLGINCLSQVTENILNQSENQQFIITSHHPYVINNIDVEYWKIVTRKGNVVRVRDSSEFDLGASHQPAFLKLMNLDEYEKGIQN